MLSVGELDVSTRMVLQPSLGGIVTVKVMEPGREKIDIFFRSTLVISTELSPYHRRQMTHLLYFFRLLCLMISEGQQIALLPSKINTLKAEIPHSDFDLAIANWRLAIADWRFPLPVGSV